MLNKIFPLLAASALADQAQNGWEITCKVNTGGAYGPAFLDFAEVQSCDVNQFELMWSSFGTRSAGIYGIGTFGLDPDNIDHTFDDICDNIISNTTSPELASAKYLTWPNEINRVPFSVYNKRGLVMIPNGFATPTTFDGCLAIADLKRGPWPVQENGIQVISGGCGYSSRNDIKYFYHFVKWIDMDGDGDLDALTARGSSKTLPTALDSSQLVWFENDGTQNFQPGGNAWKMHNIALGQDLADTYLDAFVNNGNIIVIFGGFSSRVLGLIQGPIGAWNENNQNQLRYDYVDSDGYYFTQKFTDLDQDGVQDAIITIGSYGEKSGQLIVYQGYFDSNGIYGLQNKQVIYDNFPFYNSKALGVPGEGSAFNFYSDNSDAYPSILVSGDDDGAFYLFTPNVNADGSLTFGNYQYSQIYESANFNPRATPLNAPTVGKSITADIDGNGCNDIVIPNFANKQLVVISQSNCDFDKPHH